MVVAFDGIGPLQPEIDVEDANVPSAFLISKVPQKAKDVRVDPVLLLIPNISVRVPPHAQGSVLGGGKVALTNSRSFDVQELALGKVCPNVVETKKTAGKNHRTKLFNSVSCFVKSVEGEITLRHLCNKDFIIR
jgi:hypothetical protein